MQSFKLEKGRSSKQQALGAGALLLILGIVGFVVSFVLIDAKAAQPNGALSRYQTLNVAAFLILLVVIVWTVQSILSLSNEKTGQKQFAELEKDYRWRRTKVAYFALSALLMLIVIGVSYGTDERAIFQTVESFDLERTKARFSTILWLFFTVAIVRLAYRFLLPSIYRSFLRLRQYLEKN